MQSFPIAKQHPTRLETCYNQTETVLLHVSLSWDHGIFIVIYDCWRRNVFCANLISHGSCRKRRIFAGSLVQGRRLISPGSRALRIAGPEFQDELPASDLARWRRVSLPYLKLFAGLFSCGLISAFVNQTSVQPLPEF